MNTKERKTLQCPFKYYPCEDDDYDYDDNSMQFFIIYVPSQQLLGQLQTQHSVIILTK
jgi:hypothetical protein